MQTQENIENEVDAALIEKEGADRDDATQQQTTQLEQAIGRLPENQRSALMLCYYSGFSNKEAAAIMNMSVKALESSIARAKRSLRTELSESDNAQ